MVGVWEAVTSQKRVLLVIFSMRIVESWAAQQSLTSKWSNHPISTACNNVVVSSHLPEPERRATKPNQIHSLNKYLNVGAGLYFGAFLLVGAAVAAVSDTSIALVPSAARRATNIKRIGRI